MKPGMINTCGGNLIGGDGRGVSAPPFSVRWGPKETATQSRFYQFIGKSIGLGPCLYAATSIATAAPIPPNVGKTTQPAALTKDQSVNPNAVPAKTTVAPLPQAIDAPAGSVEKIRVVGIVAPGERAKYDLKSVDLGPLGDVSVLDTPFSIQGTPHDVLLNQQLRNVNDTAKYEPSVQLEERGDQGMSRPQSRGFEADMISNSRMDGLNVVDTTPYAAEQFDHVSVVTGLTGGLFGPQNPAGMFNYVNKRPTKDNRTLLNVGADGNGAPLESIDSSYNAGPVAGRLNLLNQTGQSYADRSRMRRNLVSGDFDFHLDEDTTLYADGSQYSTAYYGLPGSFSISGPTKAGGAMAALPEAPDTHKAGYGQSDSGYTTSTSTGIGRLEHKFGNSGWKLRLGGLYQNVYRNSFTANNKMLLPGQKGYTGVGSYQQTIAGAATMNDTSVWSNFAWLNGHAKTGFIKHDLVLGSTGYNVSAFSPGYVMGPNGIGTSINNGYGRIGDPRVVNGGPHPTLHGKFKGFTDSVQSFVAGDTLHFTKQLSVMGMMAWNWLRENDYSNPYKMGKTVYDHPVTKAVRTKNFSNNAVFTPTVSLVYKPVESVTGYFTWGKSIQPGDVSPNGATNQGSLVGPRRSESYEGGVKWAVNDGLMLTANGFSVERSYSYVDPVTHVFANNGIQRNFGAEFLATGHITKRLAAIAGVTWINSHLHHTGSALTNGKSVVGVPSVQMNTLLDYTLPTEHYLPGALALTANVHYTGKRTANMYGTSTVGAYVTTDLGVRYAVNMYRHPLTVRFGVDNVTNERYWASIYNQSTAGDPTAAETAFAGLPRVWQLTISTEL